MNFFDFTPQFDAPYGSDNSHDSQTSQQSVVSICSTSTPSALYVAFGDCNKNFVCISCADM